MKFLKYIGVSFVIFGFIGSFFPELGADTNKAYAMQMTGIILLAIHYKK